MTLANERLCMGCMQPISEFSDTCYHCGYPVTGENPDGYLRVHTALSDRYLVGRALQKRCDAIIYIGYDKTARSAVLIREFFPDGLCGREDSRVFALSGKEVAFDSCLEAFRRQVRVIARMRDLPAMLPVYDLFEENGTMYTVSDRAEGIPFRRYVQTLGGHLRWEEARPLLVPLISSLASLHAAGLCHFGISPDSILVDEDNRLRLDGWVLPQQRRAGGEKELAAGYAAPEQYDPQAPVGQAADVYGLSATILYALTGEEPPRSPDRLSGTASLQVPANLADEWPVYIAPTLREALSLDQLRRIPTMEQLRDRLTVAPVVEALREEGETALSPDQKGKPSADAPSGKKQKGYKAAVVTLVIVCVLLAAAIAGLLICGNPFAQKAEQTDVPPVTTTTTVVTRSTATQAAVEDVVGRTYISVRDELLNGNMKVKLAGKQFSDTVPKGTILSQDPMPETFADLNTEVSVIVSDGPEQKPLIDLAGWERTAARVYLEAMGYTVQEVEITVSSYERGRVDNMSPAAGTPLREGDTVVLQISNVTTTTAAPTTHATFHTANAGYSFATTRPAG